LAPGFGTVVIFGLDQSLLMSHPLRRRLW
jgi:hypothetical protein